ncbi:ABC transporter substrate-binding protein [Enterovirga rhinocerotis]|uniref:Branched-chain amino acid transport system substrate-binding protein n=1 Tax=Enterovirga rhinocerotis TaxID=1339210 RepID=A0A4R7BJ74_9HYPH|nr:branched-chain amino acid transport system substrate-binding protein [Enterovirga rhinocerotis]
MIRSAAIGIGAALWTAMSVIPANSQATPSEPIRIGVLDDMSGMFADQQGMGDAVAARMAVSDFGGKLLGRPIEVIHADHLNKTDVGAQIARGWFDQQNVQMITGLGNSAVALAVQSISRDKNRIQMTTSGGTAELTGKSCSPNGTHWVFDTFALAKVTGSEAVRRGANSWYFITADYAFGHALEQDTAKIVKEAGGTVAGVSRYPGGSSDFASYLLRAQSSRAKVIGLANSGSDMVNAVKQANEFGNVAGGQQLVALLAFTTNLKEAGLAATKGLIFTEAFYWDQTEETRAFSKRFAALHHNRPPTSLQAGTYSATLHYLKAVAAAGTLDAATVMRKMRELPVNDFMTKNGRLRQDGRLIRDMYLLQAKSPEESKGEWDLAKVIATVPGEQAFRPMNEGECPLVKQ